MNDGWLSLAKSCRWNILSAIVEFLLLRLLYSSCEDLQKPKVVDVEGKQEEKRGVAMALSSTWQVLSMTFTKYS